MTNKQAPSATVDEPKYFTVEQRQDLFNFFHDKEAVLMEDDFNTIERIVYPRTYPYTLKDEQQVTVDVEHLKDQYASRLYQKIADLNHKGRGWAHDVKIIEELLREIIIDIYLKIQHSQQPTVEVEKIARECVDSLEEAKLLEVSALTERINLSDREDAVRIVSKALTEALRGSYSREEVITIITSVNTELISGRREADDWLTDYDTERGMKNG